MNEERSFPFDFCNVPRSKEFMLKMKFCKKPCVVWVQCDSPQPVRMECLTTKLWNLVSHRVFPGVCISFSYKLHKNVPWYHLGSVVGTTWSHRPSEFPQNHSPETVQRNKLWAVEILPGSGSFLSQLQQRMVQIYCWYRIWNVNCPDKGTFPGSWGLPL